MYALNKLMYIDVYIVRVKITTFAQTKLNLKIQLPVISLFDSAYYFNQNVDENDGMFTIKFETSVRMKVFVNLIFVHYSYKQK